MDNRTPNQTSPTSENKSSIGGVIATIIIIAIMILGALYFWGKRLEENKAEQAFRNENNATQTAAVIENVSTTTEQQ